ncbi:Uncharacterised protein [Bacteroides thetaiotaomicron]|jgi:hypothetical protein|uniref:Uncharacterized protein n=1 Tax=Bacteroides thetaiotaomicron TaxID=818 RepID=A0A174PQT0_BACT4|nr:Uncharacterised protein [Bacteroides thetaiotaomicron]
MVLLIHSEQQISLKAYYRNKQLFSSSYLNSNILSQEIAQM